MTAGPWVKLEKSLYLDARIHAIARELKRRAQGPDALPSLVSIDHNAFVAMAIGAVGILWITCEQLVDDFDRVPYTPDDIDQFVGIKGFCELLPAEWLVIVDGYVTLPNFHKHNGTLARKNALNARRMAQARALEKRTQSAQKVHKRDTKGTPRTKN
jgi:hypothetical protein